MILKFIVAAFIGYLILAIIKWVKQQLKQPQKAFFRKEKAGGRISHEKGMVCLALSSGKADGLNVSPIVGSLAHHADISGRCIGKIRIENQTTFVDVPEEVAGLVLAKKSSYRIGRRRIDIERA